MPCAANITAASGRASLSVEVPIISGLLFRRAEGGVGLGDLHEALGGSWVVGVQVGMVGFGELVELPMHQNISIAAWEPGIIGSADFFISPAEALAGSSSVA